MKVFRPDLNSYKKNIILQDKYLMLRPVTLADVSPKYVQWLNDPAVNRCLETRFHAQTPETVREYILNMSRAANIIFQAIILLEGNRHIGNIKLGPIVEQHRRGEISFWLGDKTVWGRGLGTKAVALLIDYAFNSLRLHKITGGAYSNNPASCRIFEKLSFRQEAVLQKHYLANGQWVDRICFAKFAGD